MVVRWITVYAAKSTFFSYLSMKLSCPLKLRVTEIKPRKSLAFPIPFKYSIIYGFLL